MAMSVESMPHTLPEHEVSQAEILKFQGELMHRMASSNYQAEHSWVEHYALKFRTLVETDADLRQLIVVDPDTALTAFTERLLEDTH